MGQYLGILLAQKGSATAFHSLKNKEEKCDLCRLLVICAGGNLFSAFLSASCYPLPWPLCIQASPHYHSQDPNPSFVVYLFVPVGSPLLQYPR